MNRHHSRSFALAVIIVSGIFPLNVFGAPTLQVPSGLDHAPWDALVKKYVDDRGLIDYESWTQMEEDLRLLDEYIAAFSESGGNVAIGDEEIAGLINAYNAFTVRWILENFPVTSIRETRSAWPGERWNIGGREVSLEEIEHENLRKLFGWKVHATIVCAARSCPPLQRNAFTAENLNDITAQAFEVWLGREDLNRFEPEKGRVRVSKIFSWFADDFAEDGGLANVLEMFGPEEHRSFFHSEQFDVEYLDYNWGLNDQGDLGSDYKPGVRALLKSVF